MRQFIFFILTGLVLTGCRDECFYSREPELAVVMTPDPMGENFRFEKIYSPGGKEVVSRQGKYFLPVSLHADSVTYLFQSPGRIDSLTIFYTRRFFFESEKCGFVAELENVSTGRPVRTTFRSAWVTFSESKYGVRSNVYAVEINP